MEEMVARIQAILHERNITQRQLADMLHIAPTTINGFIKGRNKLGDRTITDMCNVLGIRETWLRTGEGEMERDTLETLTKALIQTHNLSETKARLAESVIYALSALDDDDVQEITDRIMTALQKTARHSSEDVLVSPAEIEAALSEDGESTESKAE